MSHLVAFALCVAGFAALALATRRQQGDVFGRPLAPATTTRLRSTGWLALLLALVWLVGLRGWAMGLVIYSGQTSLAAGLVLLALVAHGRKQAGKGRAG